MIVLLHIYKVNAIRFIKYENVYCQNGWNSVLHGIRKFLDKSW